MELNNINKLLLHPNANYQEAIIEEGPPCPPGKKKMMDSIWSLVEAQQVMRQWEDHLWSPQSQSDYCLLLKADIEALGWTLFRERRAFIVEIFAYRTVNHVRIMSPNFISDDGVEYREAINLCSVYKAASEKEHPLLLEIQLKADQAREEHLEESRKQMTTLLSTPENKEAK